MEHPKQHWFQETFQKISRRLPAAGTVAFVFTDIEDSSTYWDKYGAEFQAVKQRLDSDMLRAAKRWQGQEITPTGDGFFFIFSTPSRAIRFAVEMQSALMETPLTVMEGQPLKVRVGIHVGETVEGDGGTYDGPNTSLAARVCAAGHGGQILASREACLGARANLPVAIDFRDLGSYHLKGFAQEIVIFQILAPLLSSQFPALSAESAHRTHLPTFMTPFLGRAALLARLTAMLDAPNNRLVVLAGPGGVGKTRLSVQAAEGVAGFADGIWFVDAQTALNAPALFARIVQSLGLLPLAHENEEDCALRSLTSRAALLVLDNLDQVEDAASGIERLLKTAPHLHVLVTTREWLPLKQARTLEIEPLSLPDPLLEDAEAALATESVQFFLERAGSHRQDFRPDAQGVLEIARLCRALDGVPLALELAAGWISVMGPKDILSELSAHSQMLASEYADLPERQRTVQASLDWSYRRLRPEDQTLLAHLSVFAGGFDRSALEAVCGDTLLGVRRLVERSLLTRRSDGSTTRYHLLNITRAYAAEKLLGDDQAPVIRDRHVGHFTRRAAECVGQWRTAGESAAFAALESERDNLAMALAWTLESRQPLMAAELLLSRGAFLERCGFLREAQQDIEAGWKEAQNAGLTETPLGASLLRERAGIFLDLLNLKEARDGSRAFLDLSQSLNIPQEIGYGHNLLGATEKAAGCYKLARDEFQAALSCFQENGATVGTALVLNNLGLTDFEDPDGDPEDALRWWKEAMSLFHAAGDRRGMAEVATNLGNLAESRNEWNEAASRYTEALDLELALGHAFGVARSLSNVGEIAQNSGHGAAAYRLCAGAQALLERAGSPFAETRRPLLIQAAAALSISPSDRDSLVQSLKRKPLDALVRWAREAE